MNETTIYPWGNARRFNSYAEYFKKLFGSRVQKISVNAGFTCPNRDGSKGKGGCTFCNNDAFNPSYCQPQKSVTQQINEGIEFHRKRYRRAKNYLVYFQAYTNTYLPIALLENLYAEALGCDGVVGLVIGTRPDCINDDIIRLLQKLQQSAYIMLEFGVESVYDHTLLRVNRGHDFAQSIEAIEMASAAGLPCGGHFIFGLPGETRQQMLDSIEVINKLPLQTIKFHQLQIFKNTAMAKEFRDNPGHFELFNLEDYIDFIIKVTERLNPNFMIERFAGEVPPRYLESTVWDNVRYDTVLSRIENKMEKLDTFQGKIFY
ncbi:MAG: TIGR01212 family radical SAM protein [Bacteroidales bacterium]|nr:TIGR01212 family radical SAM protein [Bacteroidales bacterium]